MLVQVCLGGDPRKQEERSGEVSWEDKGASAGSRIKQFPAVGSRGSVSLGSSGTGCREGLRLASLPVGEKEAREFIYEKP